MSVGLDFQFSFYILCGLLFWMSLRGIIDRRAILEFPSIAGLMGLAWVVPQGIELESNPSSPYSSAAFWIYVSSCFLFIRLGFSVGINKANGRSNAIFSNVSLRSFRYKRLLISATGLMLLGYFSVYQIRGIDTSAMNGQWTGVITMWALLSKANGFALCIAVLVFCRTGSVVALFIALFSSLPLISSAFLGVRREALFDLVILTVGAWCLARRTFPPRWAVIVGFVVGTVVLNSVGQIRGAVRTGDMSFIDVLTTTETYRSFDYFDLGQGTASELGLARYDFWYVNQTWHWEFGAEHWNSLVHQYVPAFLLGRNFKESLKFSTLGERLRRGEEEGAFSLGSTRTGFSDSYRGFGVFGVLIFGLIGFSFGVLYARAVVGGFEGQYWYLILLAEGLKAITHSTGEFLQAIPFTVLLSGLVLWWAGSLKRGKSIVYEDLKLQ
jgi:hypothetical protein